MKCPYCGKETKEAKCPKCFAIIKKPKPKKSSKEEK